MMDRETVRNIKFYSKYKFLEVSATRWFYYKNYYKNRLNVFLSLPTQAAVALLPAVYPFSFHAPFIQ